MQPFPHHYRVSASAAPEGAPPDCFMLTFRAHAGIARFPWISLACEVGGTVERIDRVTQFTSLTIRPRLEVAPGADREQALRLLAKAESGCLVSNSLKSAIHLEPDVVTAEA